MNLLNKIIRIKKSKKSHTHIWVGNSYTKICEAANCDVVWILGQELN